MHDSDEQFDGRLRRAGRVQHDPAILETLEALVAAGTASTPKPEPRRPRRRFLLAGGLGLAMLFGGGAAVAANQWAPWSYVPEPDYVIARDWVDAQGKWLGACESHVALGWMDDEIAEAVRAHLDEMDIDAIEPDPSWVRVGLAQVDRLEEFDRLVPGVDIADYDLGGVERDTLLGTKLEPFQSDARILQHALGMAVFMEIAEFIRAEFGEEALREYSSPMQIQCTTDPYDPQFDTEWSVTE